jgi:hypothetical protein
MKARPFCTVPECDEQPDERVDATESAGPASCAAPRWPVAKKTACPVGDESVRSRLIADITRVIREPLVPVATREAALELIGWLARRFPGEEPHAIGVEEAVRARDVARTRRRAR